MAVLFGEPRIYGGEFSNNLKTCAKNNLVLSTLMRMFFFFLEMSEDATGYGPIFEEEPVDVVYTEDSPDGRISMNCRARANPPATYRFH